MMHVTNNQEFTDYTFFSVVKDVGYDFTIHTDAAIDSLWYAVIAMESDLKFMNIDVTNEMKIADDDFAIFNPVNLGAKFMHIENSNYDIEGTVMIAFTTLSFNALNVEIATFTLAGGFVFSTSCAADDVMVGEVVLDDV